MSFQKQCPLRIIHRPHCQFFLLYVLSTEIIPQMKTVDGVFCGAVVPDPGIRNSARGCKINLRGQEMLTGV